MTLLERFTKPEYVLRPRVLWRRLQGQTASRAADGTYTLPLPWGIALRVRRLDDVAHAVDVLGVHDLVVTEAIWRLAAPGDTLVDVGANVGYMTLAMIARLGSRGRVFAFEPQPGVFDELSGNVAHARERFPGVSVTVRPEALSDSAGVTGLVLPDPDRNRGLAHIDASGGGVPVAMQRLDAFATELGPEVALMKIDVEGHEPGVLRGASALLERRVVRHVIIEEHGRYPTEASTLLERSGYTVFSLERTFVGVRLGDPGHPRRTSWQAPSLLATREPALARRAFRLPGWRALS